MQKRMWKSICRNPLRTAAWIFTFSVFSILFFNGFSIAEILRESIGHVGERTGGSVTLLSQQNGVDDYPGEIAVYVESEKKLEKLSEHAKIWKCAATLVYGSENMEFVSMQANGEILSPQDSSGTLLSCSDMRLHPVYKDRKCKIREGRLIQTSDHGKAVLADGVDAVRKYNRKVGDSIRLISSKGKEMDLEIAGFSTDIGNNGWPWSANSCNFIFTDEDTVLSLQKEQGYRELRYQFENAEDAERFAEMIPALKLPEEKNLNIVLDTTEYMQVKSTYENLYHVVGVTIVFITVVGGIIVMLLMGYFMMNRKKEIGILLAMGESKIKIWIQMTGEVLIPLILAEMISVGISLFLNQKIAGFLLAEVKSSIEVQQIFSLRAAAYMTICNVILVAAAGVLVIVQMSRQQVKVLLEDG